jgi:hypothetical protein
VNAQSIYYVPEYHYPIIRFFQALGAHFSGKEEIQPSTPATRAIGKYRLQMLHDYVRDHVPDHQYRGYAWRTCMMGQAAKMPLFQKMGFYLDPQTTDPMCIDHTGKYLDFEKAMTHIFGLTEDESYRLFLVRCALVDDRHAALRELQTFINEMDKTPYVANYEYDGTRFCDQG